jgi:L-ascorbate metabolism protein UlaG (beta-lactamase superfamily)
MIHPLLQDEALLRDIESARQQPDQLHLWWLGQSGFLAQWRGAHLLLDPYLSDSLTRKYAGTDKPHVRLSERVIAPEKLAFVEAVTSSHNHTDHLDAETLLPISEKNRDVKLLVPRASEEFAWERLKHGNPNLVGIDAGERVSLGSFIIHAIPAAHNTLEIDASGRHRFLGYVVEAGPWRVYHSGDTLRYPTMADRLRPFNVDVALLPINGDRPERRVAGNLDGREAARLAKDIGAKCVIPCHYDLFEFNTASPDLFESTCRELDQSFQTLRLGERWTSPPCS